jgi:hypothetical protein
MTELTDTQIALMMKAALEFNATLVGLASAYYGNMDSKSAKRFQREYKKLFDSYRDTLKTIFPEEYSDVR